MPAGDLITGDWQAELRTTLMGGSSNYGITAIEITPPDIRSHDLPKLLTDGEFQGPQDKGPIYVTLTMNVTGTSETNLIANLDTLETAWAKSSTDLTFVLRLPNWGKRSVSGRPFLYSVPPLVPAETRTPARTIRGVRAQFKAGTPTWTQL